MASSSILSTFLILLLLSHFSDAAVFDIRNNCPYTIWVGAVPGGGRQLNSGQTWSLNVAAGTSQARIWPRTGCNFDGSGRGRCQTGDCNGLLACQNFGQPPNTLAEYALNQFSNLDFFDISLVDGFNVPMEFSPNSGGCTRGIRCTADINGQCPSQLRAPGGCNNPCTVFKTYNYCLLGRFYCVKIWKVVLLVRIQSHQFYSPENVHNGKIVSSTLWKETTMLTRSWIQSSMVLPSHLLKKFQQIRMLILPLLHTKLSSQSLLTLLKRRKP